MSSGRMMAVPVSTDGAFELGNPEVLFQGSYFAGRGRSYDVSPDGQRFLMITALGTDGQTPSDIVVVQNWFEELERLVPTK